MTEVFGAAKNRGLLMLVLIGGLAAACHSSNPVSHLTSQHESSLGPGYNWTMEEGWCLDMSSSYAPAAPVSPDGYTLGNRINSALTGNAPVDWQASSGALINFLLAGGCDEFDDETTPPRSAINIEYHATTSTYGSPCNADEPGNVSCVFHDQVHVWPDGHSDMEYAYVLLDVDNMGESAYHHTTNHETGHALGLTDPAVDKECLPACGYVSPYFDTCLVSNHLDQLVWVESIMHSSYYCGGEHVDAGPAPSSLTWPTEMDRYIVSAISRSENQ